LFSGRFADEVLMICVVIPAYQPDRHLSAVVRGIRAVMDAPIVVVDDGGGPEYAAIFADVADVAGVTVLRHAVNLGKGAALRTGFNAALCRHPDLVGVVTADADGQHAPDDVARIAAALAENREALVLGVRKFEGEVPLRSRVGNRLSGFAYRLLIGESLADTQTGLRGVPAKLLPDLLRSSAPGYEFELDALILARHHGFAIVQRTIRTIYEGKNETSHFNPLRDSMRISLVLFRFSLVALATTVLDNAVFLLAFGAIGSVGPAQILGRLAAAPFNYLSARKAVFLSGEPHRHTLPRYVALLAANGVVSYALITLLAAGPFPGALQAKIVAESVLFFVNFLVQRDVVFRRKPRETATDWDAYYAKPTPTAHLTRRYTTAVLAKTLRRYAAARQPAPEIVEIGGANSGFIDAVAGSCGARRYHVIDSNAYGLELLRQRPAGPCPLELHQADIRKDPPDLGGDAVFSVGLIEHFDRDGTREVVRAHFDLVRAGGTVLITFPTPTWLYRAARMAAEAAGVWRFHDERPLGREEVLEAVGDRGRLVHERILWPIVFTQRLMVFERTGR
jgi:glycosyltransferase involved in cell wall biosynthesis